MSTQRAGERSVLARGWDRVLGLVATRLFPGLGYSATVMPVRARTSVDTIRRSHLRDFTLGLPRPVRRLNLGEFTPYFADYRRGLLVFSRMPRERDQARAFFYMAQREFADRVALVPVTAFGRTGEAAHGREIAPVLVFSIGRCGSTLLSALLDTGGVASYSELDVFNQTAEIGGEVGRSMGHSEGRIRDFRETVLGVTLEALSRRGRGRRVCIKMRSGALRIFREITDCLPRAESVFLFRGVEGWARSWITAFGLDDAKMIATLEAGIAALEAAQAEGRAHRVVWYEDILRDPVGACEAILGEPVADPARIAEVMAEDSQRLSSLAATRMQARHADIDAGARIAAETERFLDVWAQVQPEARLRALGLSALAAPGRE